MNEDFLHYVWKFQQFDQQKLKTTDGQPIHIEKFGVHNHNAGPDFSHARIKIGDTRWVGNVEIHLLSSDWIRHKHQADKAYQNVILHVVYEEDKPIFRTNGQKIPCLELRQLIPSYLLQRYQKLLGNQHWIPCQTYFEDIDGFVKETWFERLLIERLEEKILALLDLLAKNKQDWEHSFYQLLAKNFGAKVNAFPFELLAMSLPLNLVRKHQRHLLQIEALLFGQAGLLETDFTDEYPRLLQREYRFLAQKYRLRPLKKEIWKFSRLRPANFPTVRIAQFASLLHKTQHLFRDLVEAKTVDECTRILDVRANAYWENHYLFDKASSKGASHIGKSTVHLILINSLAPMLFLYGREMGEADYHKKALELLAELPPENNHIIRQWKEMGCIVNSAARSQALIQLKNKYCNQGKCIQCAIGNAILKQQSVSSNI